eukprot:snap_masked-scaffold_16-processed-gene-0.18-mRNA-1 protein AED:1.00 eAED:1.00 QI:0/-1/0/0/-1/1/1/0/225
MLENFDELKERQCPMMERDLYILSPEECSSRTWSLHDLKHYVELVFQMKMLSEKGEKKVDEEDGTTYWIGADGSWKEVNAIMDSGATRTCGSYKYFLDNGVIEPADVRKAKVRMETATKSEVTLKGEIYKDIRIRVVKQGSSIIVEAPNTRILLAEGSFLNLLIGKDVLEKLDATPEKAILGRKVKRAQNDNEDIRGSVFQDIYLKWKKIYEEQKGRRHKRAYER